jgi:hypothetical protein
MSDVLTGNPANVTTPLTATITALSNNGSGEIRATTSAPHLFGTNDQVLVVAGSTDAEFAITVIDATHFDLQGSTYSSTATGTATDYALTPQILVPTDGDAFSQQLSGALSSQQAILDRTQYLAAQVQAIFNGATALEAFTSTGTWTCPAGVYTATFYLFGGGGGGAGGYEGTTSSPSEIYPGGGGGSGAHKAVFVLNVTPGDVYTIDIGAGGTGGAAGSNGGQGGATQVKLGVGTLATAQGGAPGYAYVNVVRGAGSTGDEFSWGGQGTGFGNTAQGQQGALLATVGSVPPIPCACGDGGPSWATTLSGTAPGLGFDGCRSEYNQAGGTGGAGGTNTGTPAYGGPGGGGGGGGPLGPGGNGGNGGNGNATVGTAGSAGSAAAANSGAGGGGGGTGGSAISGTQGAGGPGGAGGSGWALVAYNPTPQRVTP